MRRPKATGEGEVRRDNGQRPWRQICITIHIALDRNIGTIQRNVRCEDNIAGVGLCSRRRHVTAEIDDPCSSCRQRDGVNGRLEGLRARRRKAEVADRVQRCANRVFNKNGASSRINSDIVSTVPRPSD